MQLLIKNDGSASDSSYGEKKELRRVLFTKDEMLGKLYFVHGFKGIDVYILKI